MNVLKLLYFKRIIILSNSKIIYMVQNFDAKSNYANNKTNLVRCMENNINSSFVPSVPEQNNDHRYI